MDLRQQRESWSEHLLQPVPEQYRQYAGQRRIHSGLRDSGFVRFHELCQLVFLLSERMLLMQTAVGQAFSGLDSSYRIGSRQSGTRASSTAPTDFRNIKTFDTTQKSNFYSSLYAETPDDYTPLRGALSKVGRYYAKKIIGADLRSNGVRLPAQLRHPVRPTATGTTISRPVAMVRWQWTADPVGNQDWNEARPMYDGATTVTTLTRTRFRV